MARSPRLIDPADRAVAPNSMPPTTGGEGMTDSPTGTCRAPGHPALEPPTPPPPEEGPTSPFSAPKIMRRTAPPSRTYGRSAVGLRPILDPGAAPSTRPTAGRRRPKEDQSRQADGLTRPHSFRNDSEHLGPGPASGG